MEISIVTSKGERLSILPGETVTIGSRFVIVKLTGYELLEAINDFDMKKKQIELKLEDRP